MSDLKKTFQFLFRWFSREMLANNSRSTFPEDMLRFSIWHLHINIGCKLNRFESYSLHVLLFNYTANAWYSFPQLFG